MDIASSVYRNHLDCADVRQHNEDAIQGVLATSD